MKLKHVTVIILLLSGCTIKAGTPENTVPSYQLLIPKGARITDSDPPGAIEVHDQAFVEFMKAREADDRPFSLSISIPGELKIEEDLSVVAIPHVVLEHEGKMKDLALPTGRTAYMFGELKYFEDGPGRKRIDRKQGRVVYSGLFRLFPWRCFAGDCFNYVKFAVSDPRGGPESW